MNRKRLRDETFEQYRLNLRTEAANSKARLAGTYIHYSVITDKTGAQHGVTYRKPEATT
jgi:hypothetical protein